MKIGLLAWVHAAWLQEQALGLQCFSALPSAVIVDRRMGVPPRVGCCPCKSVVNVSSYLF